MAVLVVWQSILASDWASPGTVALGRISDARVRQFWDKGNLFPRRLGDRIRSDDGHLQPDCCWNDGVPWDMAAIYGPGVRWDVDLPAAAWIDGPVYLVEDKLAKALVDPKNQ